MWETVLESVAANGAWALLFCILLVYELRDSRNREEKYQETIASLSESLTAVESIAEDVGEIAEKIALPACTGRKEVNYERES